MTALLSGIVWFYIPLLLILYLLFTTLQEWYPLRKFKGPFLASISNIWHFNAFRSGEMHLEYYDAVEKYGDLVRISPTDLLTADPEFVRRMNAARSPYKRGKWYDYARPDGQLCSVFTETDMKKHDALRAQLAPGVCRFSAMYGAQVAYISDCIHSLQYSGREVPDLESHIDARILDFVALIERKYLSEASTGQLRPLDLGMAVPYFTLDVITDIAYGAPFGYLEKDEDLHNYIAEILIGLRIGIGIGMFPWLAKLLRTRLAMALIGSSPPGITAVLDLAKKVANSRYGEKKVVKQDMLGAFVRSGVEPEQAQIEVFSQLLAGSDTTATAIRTSIVYILSNLVVHANVLAEIDTTAKAKDMSHCSVISDTDAKALPYLQACIKENLRMHPPFAGGLVKEVPKGGDTVNGTFIPEGTNVQVCIWGIQRNKVYGEKPDVDIYRPERWLDADTEQVKQMEKMLDFIFGYGRISCLGKGVAMIEIGKVLFEIFRRFDIVLLNPLKPMRSEMLFTFQQRNMMVRISAREKRGGT